MIRYLLDTDTCVFLLCNHSQVQTRLQEVGIRTTAVSTTTLAELYFGAYNSSKITEELNKVAAFLSVPAPTLIPFDDSAAKSFGKLRADCRRRGEPLADMDLLIAATALSEDLTLVTNNVRHFSKASDLKIENWVSG